MRKKTEPFCFNIFIFAIAIAVWMLIPNSNATESNGPTVHLHYGAEGDTTAVEDFMYFVPLISLAPVTASSSPGSTQAVKMTSAKRHFSRHSFDVTCEFELTGDGLQENIFDLAPNIQRHEAQLQKGELLLHQLKSIAIHGSGAITVEVLGSVENDIPTANEVRLHFNAHGKTSPVSIDLCDLHKVNGEVVPSKEVLARVNMLTFKRAGDPPKMEVSLASVKDKAAGDTFWQNFKGRMVGAAANMMLDPLRIEAVGNQAMLDFGQTLANGSSTFTFPAATNLQHKASRD